MKADNFKEHQGGTHDQNTRHEAEQGQRRPDTGKSHTRDCHASWKSLNFSVWWKNPEVFEGVLVSEDIAGQIEPGTSTVSWTRRDLVGLSPSSGSSHPPGIGDNLVLMSYGSGDPSVTSRIPTIPPGQGHWHTASLSAQNGTRYLVGSQQLPLPMTSQHAGRGRASGLLAC